MSGTTAAVRDDARALSMWMQAPSAFWLHPEGPLSRKTLAEWKAEQCTEVVRRMRARR